MSNEPTKHDIKSINLQCLDGSRQPAYRCSCQKNVGDRCPEIKQRLIQEGFEPMAAWIFSMMPVNSEAQ